MADIYRGARRDVAAVYTTLPASALKYRRSAADVSVVHGLISHRA